MIPGISINQIIQYYTSDPKFFSEIDRAICTFFNVTSINDDSLFPVNEMDEGLMNEWLVFDYQMTNGKTLLQHFTTDNPLRLNESELKPYHELLNTHIYGIYEIQHIQLGQALVLRNIYTDKVYHVHEVQGTYHAEVGVLYPTRLACVNSLWYIIGADSVIIPLHLCDSARRYFLKTAPEPMLSPKETRSWIQTNQQQPSSLKLDRAAVERRLVELLREYEIDHMVSVEMIQSWLYEETEGSNVVWIATLVCNLIDRSRFSLNDINPLLWSLVDVCNVSPRHIFNGSSPQEQITSSKNSPRFTTSVTPIGGGQWMEYYECGLDFLRAEQYRKSTQQFKKAFVWLFEHKASDREIYRLFANAGVAHLANGDDAVGLALLNMAITMNKNYTFAKQQLQQLKKHSQYAQLSQHYSSKKSLNTVLAKHPARRYKAWLDYLGINFTN